MRCISPLLIRSSDRRDVVPCGKCNFCLQARRTDWSFRLAQELKISSSAKFLTLTYDGEKAPRTESGLLTLDKTDVQKFHKRLRKAQKEVNGDSIRYYSVGEYGTETLRPHYHSILFNAHRSVINNLASIWGHGIIHCGEVTPASIHYVTKYVINKEQEIADRAPPFSLMSRKPGIGSNYLKTHSSWHRTGMRSHTQVNGVINRLPRFYKEKIFTDFERKLLNVGTLPQADAAYWEEIERLSALHTDPEMYYEQRLQHAHDGVKSKVNSQNTF